MNEWAGAEQRRLTPMRYGLSQLAQGPAGAPAKDEAAN
jgi:hypothetical protein